MNANTSKASMKLSSNQCIQDACLQFYDQLLIPNLSVLPFVLTLSLELFYNMISSFEAELDLQPPQRRRWVPVNEVASSIYNCFSFQLPGIKTADKKKTFVHILVAVLEKKKDTKDLIEQLFMQLLHLEAACKG